MLGVRVQLPTPAQQRFRRGVVVLTSHPFAHTLLHRRLFLEGSKRGPQRFLHRPGLCRGERVRVVRVSHAATEAQQLAVLHLPQHAAAIGARVRRRRRGMDLTRSNVFLSGVLRSVPLAVIVMNDDLHVELWNDVAADMWGLRQDEVKGKHFLGLDIGLPVQQLRQPLLALRHAPDSVSETMIQATNRRGRPVTVQVLCASVGGAAADGHGVIVLMQESEQSVN